MKIIWVGRNDQMKMDVLQASLPDCQIVKLDKLKMAEVEFFKPDWNALIIKNDILKDKSEKRAIGQKSCLCEKCVLITLDDLSDKLVDRLIILIDYEIKPELLAGLKIQLLKSPFTGKDIKNLLGGQKNGI